MARRRLSARARAAAIRNLRKARRAIGRVVRRRVTPMARRRRSGGRRRSGRFRRYARALGRAATGIVDRIFSGQYHPGIPAKLGSFIAGVGPFSTIFGGWGKKGDQAYLAPLDSFHKDNGESWGLTFREFVDRVGTVWAGKILSSNKDSAHPSAKSAWGYVSTGFQMLLVDRGIAEVGGRTGAATRMPVLGPVIGYKTRR